MKNLISNNNHLLSTIFLLLLCLFYPNTIQAQVLQKKIQVQLGFASSNLHTTENYSKYGFVFPSYFHNLGTLNGFSVKAQYSFLNYVAFGIETGFQHQSLSQDNFYRNSSFNYYHISPFLQLQTPEASKGLFNQLGIYAGASVVSGNLSVKDGLLKHFNRWSLWYDIHPAYRPYYSKVLKNHFTGYKFYYGARFNVNNRWGLFITRSFFYNNISSAYIPDKEFKGTEITAGVYLRFMSVKRYYQ